MNDDPDDQIQGRLFDPHLTGRLLGYIRPYLWPMVVGLVMLILLSLSTYLQPLLTKHAVEDIMVTTESSEVAITARDSALLRICGFLVVFVVLSFALRAGQLYLMRWVGEHVIRDLRREVFGPVLHVCRYRSSDLEQVVDDINNAGYGLTFGIHSRIQSTVERITRRIKVGNIYVNRNTIGAVVGVQPFGGEGLSGTGPKAGGPRYLHRFAVERSVSIDTTAAGGNTSLLSLEYL